MSIPQEVIDLAQKRVEARNNKDYALSDQLRDEIAIKGYLVKDTASGFDLIEFKFSKTSNSGFSINSKPVAVSFTK